MKTMTLFAVLLTLSFSACRNKPSVIFNSSIYSTDIYFVTQPKLKQLSLAKEQCPTICSSEGGYWNGYWNEASPFVVEDGFCECLGGADPTPNQEAVTFSLSEQDFAATYGDPDQLRKAVSTASSLALLQEVATEGGQEAFDRITAERAGGADMGDGVGSSTTTNKDGSITTRTWAGEMSITTTSGKVDKFSGEKTSSTVIRSPSVADTRRGGAGAGNAAKANSAEAVAASQKQLQTQIAQRQKKSAAGGIGDGAKSPGASSSPAAAGPAAGNGGNPASSNGGSPLDR